MLILRTETFLCCWLSYLRILSSRQFLPPLMTLDRNRQRVGQEAEDTLQMFVWMSISFQFPLVTILIYKGFIPGGKLFICCPLLWWDSISCNRIKLPVSHESLNSTLDHGLQFRNVILYLSRWSAFHNFIFAPLDIRSWL